MTRLRLTQYGRWSVIMRTPNPSALIFFWGVWGVPPGGSGAPSWQIPGARGLLGRSEGATPPIFSKSSQNTRFWQFWGSEGYPHMGSGAPAWQNPGPRCLLGQSEGAGSPIFPTTHIFGNFQGPGTYRAGPRAGFRPNTAVLRVWRSGTPSWQIPGTFWAGLKRRFPPKKGLPHRFPKRVYGAHQPRSRFRDPALSVRGGDDTANCLNPTPQISRFQGPGTFGSRERPRQPALPQMRKVVLCPAFEQPLQGARGEVFVGSPCFSSSGRYRPRGPTTRQ